MVELSDEKPGHQQNPEDEFVIIQNPESEVAEEQKNEEPGEDDEEYKEWKMFEELKALTKPSAYSKFTVNSVIISLIGKMKDTNNEIVAIYIDNVETTSM